MEEKSMRPRANSVTLLAAALITATVAITAPESVVASETSGSATVPDWDVALTAEECLARDPSQIVTLAGLQSTSYVDNRPPADTTYDLRDALWVSTETPTGTRFNIGAGSAKHPCIIGGTVRGNLPLDESRDGGMYHAENENGGALYRYGGLTLTTWAEDEWSVIDGLSVDNFMDGIKLRGRPYAFTVVRNVMLTNIRDDCIEMDNRPKSLLIQDSLMECFVGLSERAGSDNPDIPTDVTTVFDDVLLHMSPMARRGETGNAFKWSNSASDALHIKDSIIRYDGLGFAGVHTLGFPVGTTAENSTLVWLGRGDFPLEVPDGMTVVTGGEGEQLWNAAKADWLERHGYDGMPPAPPQPPSDPEAEPLREEGGVTYCSGVVEDETVTTDLVVPNQSACELNNTTVEGNVTVGVQADFVVNDSDLGGRIDIEKRSYVSVANSTISSDIATSDGIHGLRIESSVVSGDVTVHSTTRRAGFGSKPYAYIIDSVIGGDVYSTLGEVLVSGSSIGGDLTTHYDDEFEHPSGNPASPMLYTDVYDSVIKGDLSVSDNVLGATVCGSMILGDGTLSSTQSFPILSPFYPEIPTGPLQVGTSDECDGSSNYWGGDLDISENATEIALSGNVIEGALTGTGNVPAPMRCDDNEIGGDVSGQFADLNCERARS